MPGRKRHASGLHLKLASAPCDEAIVGKTHSHFAEIHFKTRQEGFVANETVCDPERMRIQRTANGDTISAMTIPAEILHRCESTCA